MASITTDRTSHLGARVKQYFAPTVQKQLEAEDSAAGRAVFMILISIFGFGLVSMIISLWLAI